jgi:DnaK suppressor protein
MPKKAKMSKKDLAFFEDLLNQKKEVLLQELGYFDQSNHGESTGDLASQQLADQASANIDTEQAFRLASREGKLLNFLEDALRKVKEGTYGICVECQELIPKARLEAVPVAKMCIECKMAKEEAAKA